MQTHEVTTAGRVNNSHRMFAPSRHSDRFATQMKKKGDKRIAKDGTVYLVTKDGPWIKWEYK
jgi:hypothetical protein